MISPVLPADYCCLTCRRNDSRTTTISSVTGLQQESTLNRDPKKPSTFRRNQQRDLQILRMTAKSPVKLPLCIWCQLIPQSFVTFMVQTLLGLRHTAACATFLLLNSHHTSVRRAKLFPPSLLLFVGQHIHLKLCLAFPLYFQATAHIHNNSLVFVNCSDILQCSVIRIKITVALSRTR